MDQSIICRKCGKKYPPSKLKYFKTSKNLLCINCIEKIKNPKLAEEEQKKPGERRKIRYVCRKCKHVCRIKEGFSKQCPFCGDFDLIPQEWNSDLDALIKESSKKIYDT